MPEAVDYQKLLPILPEPLSGWTADEAEGSTEDVGGFLQNHQRASRLSQGRRRKGALSAALPVLDSVQTRHYVSATTEAWKSNSDSSEGYAKSK